jgi:hypothetical protein
MLNKDEVTMGFKQSVKLLKVLLGKLEELAVY